MEENRKEILEALNFRHSCKEFIADKIIPQEDFALIMEAAHLSPSSFGFEPWKFLVVQSPALREKLRAVAWGAQKQLPSASHFLVLLARTGREVRPESDYIRTIMQDVQHLPDDFYTAKKGRVEDFFRNDIKIWDSDEEMFLWASKQVYIALGNMLLTAACLKIDSCPIEGFNRDKVEEILQNEGLMNREEFGVCCMAAFGYRKNNQGPRLRRDIGSIFEWIG